MKVLVFILSLAVLNSAAKLPSQFQRCKEADIKCLTAAIEDALPKLASGLPEMGVPALDPMEIPKMKIGAGASVVKLDQFYEDALIIGLSKCKVTGLVFDIKKGVIKINLACSELRQEAKYSINGKILLLPVYGNGTATLKLDKATGLLEFKPDVVTKNGQEYLKVSESKLTLDCEHAAYRFENLFNGNKELGENINNVINDNWREIFDEVISGYSAVYAIALQNIANRIFNKVPLNELFLE